VQGSSFRSFSTRVPRMTRPNATRRPSIHGAGICWLRTKRVSPFVSGVYWACIGRWPGQQGGVIGRNSHQRKL
jgi:hypothetical protein